MVEKANSFLGSKTFDLKYGYSTSGKSDSQARYLTLLKPHGSIDWFGSKRVEAIKTRAPADFCRVGPDVHGYNGFRRREHHKLHQLTPEIIPPSHRKAFKTATAHRTWQDVYRSLRRASEIYVIGYSLPPEDQFARFVLRRVFRNAAVDGLHPRITVINPASSVLDRFEDVVGTAFQIRFEHTTFEKWLTKA
jgi:hypothetical protein